MSLVSGDGGVLRRALAYRDFRYLLASSAISRAGDLLYNVALFAWVYEETGSAGWVAVVSFARLIPYVILGPLGGVVADRYDRRSVMIASDVIRALLMAALAGAVGAGAPVSVAVVLATAATIASCAFGPAASALTPTVVKETDLAAANAVATAVENGSWLVGPSAAAVILAFGDASLAFWVNAGTFLLSAAFISAVRARGAPARGSETSIRQRLVEGFGALSTSSQVTVLVVFLVAATFVYGQEIVLLVLVANERLGTGATGLACLTAAVGLGGLAAAPLTGRLADDGRPVRTLVIMMTALGVPLASLAFISSPPLAYGLMAFEGAGNLILEVVVITTLQRAIRGEVLARVFGILDSLSVAGTLLGSALAPLLVALIGLRPTLVVAGSTLPVIALLGLPALRGVDRQARERKREVEGRMRFLSTLAVFDGATAQSLEGLAGESQEELVAAGSVVIEQGADPDDFFVVQDGHFQARWTPPGGGAPVVVNELDPGNWFGEIGIIEGVPRTATVVAIEDSTVLRIPGEAFVTGVLYSPLLSGVLLDRVAGRLAHIHAARTRRRGPQRAAPSDRPPSQ